MRFLEEFGRIDVRELAQQVSLPDADHALTRRPPGPDALRRGTGGADPGLTAGRAGQQQSSADRDTSRPGRCSATRSRRSCRLTPCPRSVSPRNLHAIFMYCRIVPPSMLVHMRKHTRTLLLGVSAMLALGTLSACSSGSSTEATPSQRRRRRATPPRATAFPAVGQLHRRHAEKDGKTMTIGISVDGDEHHRLRLQRRRRRGLVLRQSVRRHDRHHDQVPRHARSVVRRQRRQGRPDDERRHLRVHRGAGARARGHVHRRPRRRAGVVGGAARRLGGRRAVQRRHQRARLRAGRAAAAQGPAVPVAGAQQAQAAAGAADRSACRTAASPRPSTARGDRRRSSPATPASADT